MSPDDIRDLAAEFDRALMRRDVDEARALFDPECRLDLLGLTLTGSAGAERFLGWLFALLPRIDLQEVIALVQPPALFQEHLLTTELPAGERIESRQGRVTVWRGGRITELRLIFDRLDLAPLLARGRLAQLLVRRFRAASVARL